MNVEELRERVKWGRFRGAYKRAALFKRVAQDWAVTHLFTGSTTVQTSHGFKLVAGKYHANLQMQAGTFEPHEVGIVKEYLPQVELFVDVGANVGYYTCFAAAAGKKVLAFEPLPRNLANLFESIRVNGFEQLVEVFPMALGKDPAIVDIFGSSGPSASLLSNWGGFESSYKRTISVSTMDRLVTPRVRGRAAFIKIDVEGFELNVLQGAAELIACDPKPVWLLECTLSEYPGGNPNYERTLNIFFDAGYRVFAADAQRTEVTREDVRNWQLRGETSLRTFDYLIHV